MKRFTDTDKWRDPWFRLLSSPAKQLWGYFCDNCDCVGLIEINLKLISADVGQKVTPENILELGDRIQDLGGNRYFIPKFINFQYGEISEGCPAHRPVIRQITQRGLFRDGIAYRYPTDTLSSEVTANQQTQYPSARVAIPLRKDKIGKDKTGEGGAGGNNGSTVGCFEDFWKAYPKKTGRYDAEHAFAEVHAGEHMDEILSAIERQKGWETWNKEGGQFIPSPSNWLRDGRWHDKPPECGYQKSIL